MFTFSDVYRLSVTYWDHPRSYLIISNPLSPNISFFSQFLILAGIHICLGPAGILSQFFFLILHPRHHSTVYGTKIFAGRKGQKMRISSLSINFSGYILCDFFVVPCLHATLVDTEAFQPQSYFSVFSNLNSPLDWVRGHP